MEQTNPLIRIQKPQDFLGKTKNSVDVTFGFRVASCTFNENLHEHINLDLADDASRTCHACDTS